MELVFTAVTFVIVMVLGHYSYEISETTELLKNRMIKVPKKRNRNI